MSNPPPNQPNPGTPVPVEPIGYASAPVSMLHSGVTCPQCGMNAAQKVTFSMWGGVLGPKMLNHHKCQACKFGFNGRTGKSNRGAIWIYCCVGWALGLTVFFYFMTHRR